MAMFVLRITPYVPQKFSVYLRVSRATELYRKFASIVMAVLHHAVVLFMVRIPAYSWSVSVLLFLRKMPVNMAWYWSNWYICFFHAKLYKYALPHLNIWYPYYRLCRHISVIKIMICADTSSIQFFLVWLFTSSSSIRHLWMCLSLER